MESYNPHREIVHQHVFTDVVFWLEDQELIIETLGYPDTYFEKWFMHVCYRVQQDPVGKDKIPFLSYLYGFLELMIVEEPFGLSGHILREMVHACLLPGATRSSW